MEFVPVLHDDMLCNRVPNLNMFCKCPCSDCMSNCLHEVSGVAGTSLEKKFIGLMTRKEIIDEILDFQRDKLEELSATELKGHVVNCRSENYNKQLMAEAGLVSGGSLFGMRLVKEDKEDEED